ncbi:MAG: ATP-binding protein [Saprospiraceae bacterium]
MNMSLRLLRLRIRAAFMAVWVGVCSFPLFSQGVYNPEHLTPEDGLSFRWAFDIAQDSMGYIWIATFDGLNRYDGHRFVSYRPNYPDHPDFEANRFMQVDCLSGHDVLVTTPKGILLRLNRAKDRLELVWPDSKQDYPVKARMMSSPDGHYRWALLGDKNSADERLCRIVSPVRLDTILLLGSHPRIHKQVMAPPDAKRLWCRSDGIYFVFDLEKRTEEMYPFNRVPGAIIAHPVLPIDGQNRFWHPGPEGGFRFFQLPWSVPVAHWEQFRLDNKGNFWIWTREKKMFRYCPSNARLEAMGLFDFWEHTMGNPFEDREGTIWIPHFYGVTKLVPRRRLFENYLNQPLNALGGAPGGKSVGSIVEGEDGAVYLKIPGPAYCRLQPEANTLDPGLRFVKLKNEAADSLARQAINRLRPEDPMQAENLIYYYDAPNHLLWLCLRQSKGLYRFDAHNLDQYQYFELTPSVMTTSAILSYGGFIWVGHHDGLIRYDPKTGSRLHFTTKEGLPHNIIYSILQDGPMLWIGTHNGLCRFDTRTNETKNYYVEDGLTHNEFNTRSALRASDGKLYFGGLNGLNVFRPADLEAAIPRYCPSLYLTRFSKLDGLKDSLVSWNNPTVDGPNQIRLHPADRSVTFEFSINSYVNPAQNRYLYYLDDWESPWSNETRDGRAVYQYLPPGNYVLRVKAADPFGNAAANEIALPIEMPRVWYLRWWAWFFYVAVLLFGGRALYRIRLRQYLEHREALRLQELDEIKTKLYTNITHEFRTPLTIILGMTEQLAGEQKNGTSKVKLDIIQRNGENLLHLVNQLLDLAKLESGKLSLHLVQADMVQYLRYVAGSFHSFAAYKNIELHFLPHKEQFPMDFDKDRMLHILSNLLSNAVKFTDTGGHIYLQTAVEGDRLLIKIKDTGIGIPADKLPQIFDRFYQVDDSQTRQGEGTGIGLTLVHEMVQLMGGTISVQSRPGKGSEFIVSLPVTHKAPLAGDMPGVSPLRGHVLLQTPPKLVEETGDSELPLLLTVEDNADVAAYIRSCLNGQFRIIHAANGEEGIEKAQEEVPDLIISDVMMPVKDGFELVQTLKQDARTNHIPIVLLTAKADITSKLEGLERGADAYLSKPFHPKELQLMLRNLLDRQRRLQEKYAGQDFSAPAAQIVEQTADPQTVFLEQATHAILARLDDALFGNEELSRQMTMSESQLNRKIKALTGQTLSLFIRSARLREGRKLLMNTGLTVSEIAYAVGFTDPAYFSRTFSAEFGKAPSETRN